MEGTSELKKSNDGLAAKNWNIEDELTKAHRREDRLHEELSACLSSFENQCQVPDETCTYKIYMDMAVKLKKSNDALTTKNKKLDEENKSLRESMAAGLQQDEESDSDIVI